MTTAASPDSTMSLTGGGKERGTEEGTLEANDPSDSTSTTSTSSSSASTTLCPYSRMIPLATTINDASPAKNGGEKGKGRRERRRKGGEEREEREEGCGKGEGNGQVTASSSSLPSSQGSSRRLFTKGLESPPNVVAEVVHPSSTAAPAAAAVPAEPPPHDRPCVIANQDDVILTMRELLLYRRSFLFEALYWLLGFLTAGSSLLLCHWYPKLEVFLRYVQVQPADPHADIAMATSLDGVMSLCLIQTLDPKSLEWLPNSEWRRRRKGGKEGGEGEMGFVRRFDWRYERFWYMPECGGWTRRAFDLNGLPFTAVHRLAAKRVAEGILDEMGRAKSKRMATYGANITDINVPPYSLMVLIEVLKPFFIFQVFSLTIWALQQYYYYMYSILFMTAYAVLANAYGEWKNLRALQSLAKSESVVDRVCLDPVTGQDAFV
ncbi:hypothetical protein VYU27_009605, partial [Nannochloropsis oceanica]